MSSPVSGQIYGDLLDELWTQDMTGADVTNTAATDNIWTFDVAGQSWTALTDISASGNSLTAGQGFLVYVFTDTDQDGDNDLPVTLSITGDVNISSSVTVPSSGSIDANEWALAGNPYSSTVDWDDITKTNVDTVMTAIERLPIEFQVITLKDVYSKQPDLKDHLRIKKWVSEHASEMF